MVHLGLIVPLYASPIAMRDIERQKDIVVYCIQAEEPRVEIPKKMANDISSGLAEKQAEVKSTQDYINYFQLIRDMIRQRLKTNYRNLYKEGDVNLNFILYSTGSLASVKIDSGSTPDSTLVDIATRSIKEVSPFPAFPKAINLPSMSFDLKVSFKKE